MSIVLERIFKLLESKGIEQKEFAKLLGTSDKTVSAWKTGRSRSYTKYLTQIAEVLDTNVDFLINGNYEIFHSVLDIPPQESLDELLCVGKDMIEVLFHHVQTFIADSSDLIERLNTPTCAIRFDISFYDHSVEQTKQPVTMTEGGLSSDEQSLIERFRRFSPEQQQFILSQVKGLADLLETPVVHPE